MKKALICLHLGTVFTLIASALFILLLFLDEQVDTFSIIFAIVLCTATVVWYEATAIGLKKLRPWAWKSSVVIFGLYIPSLFIVMGLIGMKSVTSDTVREQIFGKKDASNQAEPKSFAEIIDNEKRVNTDKTVDEYIESNEALKRYLSYKKNDKN